MVKVVRTSEFDLSDYFCHYGFGDGDDVVGKDAGDSWKGQVVDWLNEAFAASVFRDRFCAKEGTDSIHNNCTIEIADKALGGEWIDLDAVTLDGFFEKAAKFGDEFLKIVELVSDRLERSFFAVKRGNVVENEALRNADPHLMTLEVVMQTLRETNSGLSRRLFETKRHLFEAFRDRRSEDASAWLTTLRAIRDAMNARRDEPISEAIEGLDAAVSDMRRNEEAHDS